MHGPPPGQPPFPPTPPGPPPRPERPRWLLPAGIGCGGLLAIFITLWVIGLIVGPPPEDAEKKTPAAAATSSSPPATRAAPATSPAPAPTPPSTTAAPSPAPSSSAPAAAPTRRRAPHPTGAQEEVYLATLERIDPNLTTKRERAIRRARGICDKLINPGGVTPERYTIYMLSGPDVQLDRRQAGQIIAAVKVWCR